MENTTNDHKILLPATQQASKQMFLERPGGHTFNTRQYMTRIHQPTYAGRQQEKPGVFITHI